MTTHTPPALAAEALELRYGLEPVVANCSFRVERGELTAMLGPSGCGKSSLVRLLAGYERPSAGRVTLDGQPIAEPGRDRLVLFQESALFPWLTTYDNVVYGPRARGELDARMRDHAEHLLGRVGLHAFRHKYPNQLSGGMQRRAELARALINRPKVMLLDEPFRGLDAMTKELIWSYFESVLTETAQTTLLVTTDVDEAVCLADRILIMAHIPTRVHAVIDVALPRPRKADVITTPQGNAIKRRALELLNAEALRAFEARAHPQLAAAPD